MSLKAADFRGIAALVSLLRRASGRLLHRMRRCRAESSPEAMRATTLSSKAERSFFVGLRRDREVGLVENWPASAFRLAALAFCACHQQGDLRSLR